MHTCYYYEASTLMLRHYVKSYKKHAHESNHCRINIMNFISKKFKTIKELLCDRKLNGK